jgi:hypothetical protein
VCVHDQVFPENNGITGTSVNRKAKPDAPMLLLARSRGEPFCGRMSLMLDRMWAWFLCGVALLHGTLRLKWQAEF